MGTTLQGSTSRILYSCIGVLGLIILILFSIYLYRLYTTRGFHLHDFHRLSKEARHLAQETSLIHKDISSDDPADPALKLANMERLAAADELDCGIRIALMAWEDIMQPDEGDALDEEGAVGGGGWLGSVIGSGSGRMVERRLRKRRKSHGRYVIGLMRGKAMEGVERRRELSRGLQAMHLEVLSRRTDVDSSLANCRIERGGMRKGIVRKAMPQKFRSLLRSRHDSTMQKLPSSASLTQHTLPEPMSPTAATVMLPQQQEAEKGPIPDGETRHELLEPVKKETSHVQVRFADAKDA